MQIASTDCSNYDRILPAWPKVLGLLELFSFCSFHGIRPFPSRGAMTLHMRLMGPLSSSNRVRSWAGCVVMPWGPLCYVCRDWLLTASGPKLEAYSVVRYCAMCWSIIERDRLLNVDNQCVLVFWDIFQSYTGCCVVRCMKLHYYCFTVSCVNM